MADLKNWNLFGFKIRKKSDETKEIKTFVPPAADDGAVTLSSSAFFGTAAIDVEGVARNEVELITRYREMAMQPELETAIEDIVNEAIVQDKQGKNVKLVLDDLKQPDKIKKAIIDEFNTIERLLNYNNLASDIFRRYYVDGRLFYQVIIDINEPKKGILELRYIDPRKIKKVRQIKKRKDDSGVEVIENVEEFYTFNDRVQMASGGQQPGGVRIAIDSVINVNSGLLDPKRSMVLSYLHKAIKPLNQLRMIEDASVIYKISRAPQRRVFYIDVGNLPTAKAEQYVRNIMTKYKNKITYDACLDLNTMVPLLDGRTLSIKEISEEYKNKDVWVYSCDPKTGKFAPGLVTWAGMTKQDQKVLKLTLDNGESIICTPDHKFPVWDKGFVEAKDLIIGESMIPYYTREKEVISGKTSTYQQIFENESKKWKFTHRLVSEWKDSVGIENEWFFKEEFSESKKQTIHHKNFNRYDNSPINLIRMNRDDHFKYHHQFNSFAGKIGGSVSGKKQKELGIGMFAMTKEQRSELGKRSGSLGGKKSYENKSGIHGISSEETLKNSKKGTKKLNELLKDPVYNKEFGRKISKGFSEESKKKMSERGKSVDKSHLIMMNKLANESRWGTEKGAENRRKITIEYLGTTNSLVDYCAKNNFSVQKAANYITNNINIEEWKNLNEGKSINNRKIESFTPDDLYRICKLKGFSGWKDCKESFSYRNHKITKIEYLEDTMDVGTLTIDGNEIYHNYHTFALSCGIYTKNSTGEIRDSRNHLSILEDYWFPRKSDGRATEVTTLQSTDNFNDMSMVEYFQKALYKSLNVPITRLDPSQAVSIGRSMEITRDELKFSKFIDKLRKKFTDLFYQALRVQLVLKGVCTEEEWQQFKEDIYFDFTVDNNFVELKESELFTERLNLLAIIDPFVNKYFSEEWVQKNILRFDDEDIETIEKQMEKGKKKDFEQQVQDTDNQVKLQARSVQMQTQLGLLPEQPQQIEAGQEEQGSPGQSAPASGKNNPYNV